MFRLRRIWYIISVLSIAILLACPAIAQDKAALVPDREIAELDTDLTAAEQAKSSARKKLAIKRVIREAESLLKKSQAAPNRYQVLDVIFRAQQKLLGLDDSTTNRKAFLATCRQLAAAPNEYAAIRLDADLLLSQTELVQQGADQKARGNALKPLVHRYLGTEVETKVVRIAMVMAIEMGDANLIGYLRQVIAEEFPGDLEMINFQRDQLAGQVFGAPFVGQFKRSDGKLARFPMDGMGKTTAMYFWSKEGDGVEQLKLLAEGWKTVPAESNGDARYQFVSFNLDGLPDAGESILREAGLDWPAMYLPDGKASPIYKTYVRTHPKLLTMTPSGYTAMVMSGASRPGRGWERNFQSALARSWSRERYASQMQSLLIGEFLIINPTGAFDPAAPPEWKAVLPNASATAQTLDRSAASVPEAQLVAIQACFVKPPLRYRMPHDELIANYKKAETLSRQAIEAHPNADDLWIVRNRRIVALMGLWKAEGKREHFDAALKEAQTAIAKGYPTGTDVVARFCLAKEALRNADADLPSVINQFTQAHGQEPASATTYAAASLLALEIADRKLHEHYRRLSLDRHAEHPMLWGATAFHLDRYHRYWLYHPPFTAGWTYGRRMGHFLAIGTPEDAKRKIQLEFKTLDGEPFPIPEVSQGKWTIIQFGTNVDATAYASRYGAFVKERPFEDVNHLVAILDDDAPAVRNALEAKKRKDDIPVLLVPGGFNNPAVQQLGILDEDIRPNIALIRPDGSLAAALSGLTMSSQHGNAMQNIIERDDEARVEEALARGDLEEAKRLAFAHAPLEQIAAPDAPRNSKPKEITVPHLRSRAKVYAAMQDWDAALADAQETYLKINSKAGWLSMRTKDLDEIEQLKARIIAEIEKANKN